LTEPIVFIRIAAGRDNWIAIIAICFQGKPLYILFRRGHSIALGNGKGRLMRLRAGGSPAVCGRPFPRGWIISRR